MSYQRPHHTALTLRRVRRRAAALLGPAVRPATSSRRSCASSSGWPSAARSRARPPSRRPRASTSRRSYALTSAERRRRPRLRADGDRAARGAGRPSSASLPHRPSRPAHDGWTMVVDPEEDPAFRSHIGDHVEGVGTHRGGRGPRGRRAQRAGPRRLRSLGQLRRRPRRRTRRPCRAGLRRHRPRRRLADRPRSALRGAGQARSPR